MLILKNGGLTDILYMPYLYKSIVYGMSLLFYPNLLGGDDAVWTDLPVHARNLSLTLKIYIVKKKVFMALQYSVFAANLRRRKYRKYIKTLKYIYKLQKMGTCDYVIPPPPLPKMKSMFGLLITT